MEGGRDWFRIVSYVATCILLIPHLRVLILVCNLVSDVLGPKFFSYEKWGTSGLITSAFS
jgi:hypothetical protein